MPPRLDLVKLAVAQAAQRMLLKDLPVSLNLQVEPSLEVEVTAVGTLETQVRVKVHANQPARYFLVSVKETL